MSSKELETHSETWSQIDLDIEDWVKTQGVERSRVGFITQFNSPAKKLADEYQEKVLNKLFV